MLTEYGRRVDQILDLPAADFDAVASRLLGSND